MFVVDFEMIRKLVRMGELIESLRTAFRKSYVAPQRMVEPIPGSGQRLFVAMPAFSIDGGCAVKLATVFPDNHQHGLPSVHASVVLFSSQGIPVAVLDGTIITRLRTAAASALASEYLSRPDSRRLLVVGTGALAPYMAEAHCSVRPISTVTVWGRSNIRAEECASRVRRAVDAGIEVNVSQSLADDVSNADVISCSTSSPSPLVKGAWLKQGVFVDLVGSFSPNHRETDDLVVQRSRIYVDTYDGVLKEGGDIVDPLRRSVINSTDIQGDLAALVRSAVAGRVGPDEITLFKSVGTAVEDFATAELVLARLAA